MKFITKKTFCISLFVLGGFYSLRAQRDASGKIIPEQNGLEIPGVIENDFIKSLKGPLPVLTASGTTEAWPVLSASPSFYPDTSTTVPWVFEYNCTGCERDSNGMWLPVVTTIQVPTFTLTPCYSCGFSYDGPCYDCIPGASVTYTVTVTDGTGCINTLYDNMNETIGAISHYCFGVCTECNRSLQQESIFKPLDLAKAINPGPASADEMYVTEQNTVVIHTLVQKPFSRKKPVKNSTPANELTCVALPGTSRNRSENNT